MIESILYFKYISGTVFVLCISNTLHAMYLYFVFQIHIACTAFDAALAVSTLFK